MLTDHQLQAAYDAGLKDAAESVVDDRQPTRGEAARLNALRAVQAAVLDAATGRTPRDPRPPLTISLDALAAVLDGAFDIGKTSVHVHSDLRTWQVRRNSVHRIPGAVFTARDVLLWRSASAIDDPRLTVDGSTAQFDTGKHLVSVKFTIVDGYERATFTR